MEQLHFLQMQILKKLLFSKGLTFTELKTDGIENNQHNFHLTKLVDLGLVVKSKNSYQLTPKGKEFANTMDTDSQVKVKQAKLSVLCCCFRKNGKEVLIYTRKKHPFYDYQGFFSGKINYGETVIETANREMFEETGLNGKPEIKGLRHFKVYSEENRLLEDKFMFYVRFDDPKGELTPNEEGEYNWVLTEDIKVKIIKPFQDFFESYELLINNEGFYFNELDVITSDF
jgi:8-oxo-dGTP pyrophosphatase MutT (NUDIX family)